MNERDLIAMYPSIALDCLSLAGKPNMAIPPILIVPLESSAFEQIMYNVGPISNAIAQTCFTADERYVANSIEFNSHYIPWLDEDECEMVLRHEMAHAIAGVDAQHDEQWSALSEFIGGGPLPVFTPRRAPELPWLNEETRLRVINEGPRPTLADDSWRGWYL